MYDIKVDNESGELFFLFEILVTVFTNVKKWKKCNNVDKKVDIKV
jgi:hypothetical protein